MKIQIKSTILGFILGFLCIPALFMGLWLLEGGSRSIFHDQVLPSGKLIKVTSFHLVWGVEHDERHVNQDSFALEFVSANPQADAKEHEQEALEVFELIRPISEQWGFNMATLSGFPTIQRKGQYNIYIFNRSLDGKWSYKREPAKVFVNDLN